MGNKYSDLINFSGACLALALTAAVGCGSVHDESSDEAEAPTATPLALTDPAVQQRLSHVAVPFQENRGQWDRTVAFKADMFAGSVWVTRDGNIVHALLGPKKQSAAGAAAATDPIARRRDLAQEVAVREPGWNIFESFVGGTPHAPHIVDASPTNVSYFIGDDETKWVSHAKTASRISLGTVWPGVEVRLQARGGSIEKFFHVAPGADLSQIEVALAGATRTRLAADGALVVTTGHNDVSFSAPIAFQEFAGARRDVSVRYVRTQRGYSFEVGEYDPRHELVIDPILQSTYLGGVDNEFARGVALAANGDVFVTGDTGSSVFPGTSGGIQATKAADDDFVVARLSPDLKTLIQSTFVGGSGQDNPSTIRVLESGDIVALGFTNSLNFPGTAGSLQASNAGLYDAAIVKLSGDLTMLVKATYIGGAQDDRPSDVVVASNGDFIIGLRTASNNFPGTTNGAQPAFGAGASDMAVVRIDDLMENIVQATYLGGDGYDEATALSLLSNGDIVVAGGSDSTSFPGTAGGFQPTRSGATDIVLVRLPGGLTEIVQSTYLGGTATEGSGAVAVASNGNILLCGTTLSSNFPSTAGGIHATARGNSDVVLVNIASDLKSVNQATYLGGNAPDSCEALAFGIDGDVIVAGYTQSAGFSGVSGGAQSVLGGMSDMNISRLSPSLTSLIQSTYFGGSHNEYAFSLAVASNGDVIVSGGTRSTNLPYASGGAQPAFVPGNQTHDMAIARISGTLRLANLASPVISSPIEGAATSASSLVIDGTCETGATVSIKEVDTVLCSSECTAGAFSCATTTLTEGTHSIEAVQVLSDTSSPDSSARSFVFDTQQPAPPGISVPASATATNDNTPEISGSCESGALVEVSDASSVLCSSVCASAAFACTPTSLADGEYQISAIQTDAAGNESTASGSVTFEVDTAPPNAPALLVPTADSITPDATPLISGSCESDATVEVLEGETLICSTTCTGGTFSCSPTTLADGLHTVAAAQTDAALNESAPSPSIAFTVDTMAPPAPVILSPADGSETTDKTPTISGVCETNASVTVTRNGTALCTAVCADNTFSCVATSLANGTHTIAATQTDLAAHTSVESTSVQFKVGKVTPGNENTGGGGCSSTRTHGEGLWFLVLLLGAFVRRKTCAVFGSN